MIYGHLFDWWLRDEDYWFFSGILKPLLGPIGATGFIFISGISAGLSYKKNKLKSLNIFFMKDVRNVFIFRALFILVISFLYNFFIAIFMGDLTETWRWFVLQTIGFSLLLTYPFLKTSKYFRFMFSLCVLIGNQIILELLSPYNGQANVLGVFYHLLFNPLNQYPILYYFPILLLGTVVGDILFKLNLASDQKHRSFEFKYKFLLFMLPFGIILLLFGLFYKFPEFFVFASYSAITYGFGEVICFFSICMIIEEYKLIKTKKSYRYLYYYSYYSFTIYLAHNLLAFLFWEQLNLLIMWIFVIILIFSLGWLLRTTHNSLGIKLSLKAGIGIVSLVMANKIQLGRQLQEA